MGGNLFSCHGKKQGHVNAYETYGSPLPKPHKSKSAKTVTSKQNGVKPADATCSEEPVLRRSKAGRTGQAKRSSVQRSASFQGSCEKGPVRLASHVTYASSTLPRMDYSSTSKSDTVSNGPQNLPQKKKYNPKSSGLETHEECDLEEPESNLKPSSSLLQLPILNHTRSVLNITRAVISEIMNFDSIMMSFTEAGILDQDTEMELMGLETKERSEKFLDRLEGQDVDFDAFIDVLRLNKNHYPLAEYVDVHHQLIKTVTELDEKCPDRSMTQGSMENIGQDCAIMHFESSYWDLETCEAIPLSETDSLSMPLKEAFDLKSKVERHRRSFYEIVTVNDWNANFNDRNNIIPVVNIDLYNQRIGLEGAKIVANLLLKYSCIRELCLAKNDIDIHGFSRIAKSLCSNHGLAKLDVRLNPLGDAGADHISRSLKVNKSLRILNMASSSITGVGINYLIGALVRNTSLCDLDICFNDLSQTNCDELSQVLKQNIYLKRLRMRHTNTNSRIYCTIFDALKTNSRLSILDISRNHLGNEGASRLAEMLVSNRTLIDLNIEKCEIQVEGVQEIARALKANTTLKTLDLSMNEMGDIGATAISEALKYNRSLQSLCMNMCHIKNNGFLALLQCFDENKSVKLLKVCFNQIGLQDRCVNVEEYYKTLAEIDDRYKMMQTVREDVKILVWGNRLEEALRVRKNGRYTTL